MLQLLVLLSPLSFSSFVAEASSFLDASYSRTKSPYKIIFDGGSTGSRLHVYEFVEVGDEDENDRDDGLSDAEPSSSTVKCVRRGSSRANVPLSSFGREASDDSTNNSLPPLDPQNVAAHLLPLFGYAAQIIPSEYHETTGVYYQATAGMRLLEESEQEAVYDALYEGLLGDDSFVFRGIQRKDVATLSGEMEAYYGVLAANFLQGIIDTELRVATMDGVDEGGHHHPIGALDMGGSSTQIVYIANEEDDTEADLTSTTCPVKQISPFADQWNDDLHQNTCRLSSEHFFSTSYLSYGVDQIRKRFWDTLVAEHRSRDRSGNDHSRIRNPCANKGYEVEHGGYTLVGSGETEECVRQMQRLIPHPDVVLGDWNSGVDDWTVGGVEHPPIRGKFLAMSLYFFSLDSLRVFSEPDEPAHAALNAAWPTPSIDELANALDGLCSRDWHGDMDLQEGVHQFSRTEVLPHRCLESAYMVTLLRDGFGFRPSSRDITFTFLVDGDEVEWTLGLALAMNANERTAPSATTTVTTTSFEYNINETGNEVFDYEPDDQAYGIQRTPHAHFFGVAMPPTHCC